MLDPGMPPWPDEVIDIAVEGDEPRPDADGRLAELSESPPTAG
jgi:hypothetical protein